MSTKPTILLTGTTGYIGGRLLHACETKKLGIRCFVRRPDALAEKLGDKTEIFTGDVMDPSSLRQGLTGIKTAFYLIHSLGAGADFEAMEYRAAKNFAHACAANKVKKIVYLGGLGQNPQHLSAHLRSRQKVGEILLASGVTVIEFRASIILGSGSLSFDMVRALVERLPIMITPRWVNTLTQPIAIEDVIAYLTEAIGYRGPSRVFEIGGPDQVSYGDLMKEYARQRGLRRTMITVPVLTPRLSSLWLGLVTPVYARVGRKLVESMKYSTVVTHPEALQIFTVKPRGCHDAIARALKNEDEEWAVTRWSDAASSSGVQPQWGGVRFGTRIVDSRSLVIQASRADVFQVIQRIGGKQGWYYGNFLWKWRGYLDLLWGGVGLRRGRRHPETLQVGQALDFWRVEEFKAKALLRLRAEMKLPGRAWLEFEVTGKGKTCTLRQTALFDPLGLAGLLYWYVLYPIHALIFRGMLAEIAKRAETKNVGESENRIATKSLIVDLLE